MPVTTIVRIEDVGACVRSVIENLNATLWEMNKHGDFVEMPEEIVFQMTVVTDFEALESSGRQIGLTSEIQGGFTTEKQTSSSSDTQKGNSTRTTTGNNSHIQNSNSTQDNYGS